MEDVTDLLAQYLAILERMHAARVVAGGKPKNWNRLVDQMQALHLRLAETPEGRQGITDAAVSGDNETTRLWSATNALAWDAQTVRPVLEGAAARETSLNDMEAKIALREFDAGRLRTDWLPNRG